VTRVNRQQHGFVTVAYSQTDTPEGSTGPAAESDIYDCLIKTVFFNSRDDDEHGERELTTQQRCHLANDFKHTASLTF